MFHHGADPAENAAATPESAPPAEKAQSAHQGAGDLCGGDLCGGIFDGLSDPRGVCPEGGEACRDDGAPCGDHYGAQGAAPCAAG